MEMGADGTDGSGEPLSDPAQKQGERKSAQDVPRGSEGRCGECERVRPMWQQIVLLLLLLPLLGIIFAGLRYSLTAENPQDDLQLVLILTVIAGILGLRIWLIQWKADKTLRYFLMTQIINAPGNRNGAYAGAAQRTADQTWGRTAYAQDAAYADDAAYAGRRYRRFGRRWKNRKSGSGWRNGTCRRRTGVTAACRQFRLRHLHWGESYFCTRLRTGLIRPMTLRARCFCWERRGFI